MDTIKTVGPNQIIEIKYILREANAQGEIHEVMDENWPFKFLFGAGALLPEFENQLEGLAEGQMFEFTIPAEKAYGQPDVEKKVQVFLDEIEENHRYPIDNYEEGDNISLVTKDKRSFVGTIEQLTDQYMVVDGNHAMVGKNLHFVGQILNIRDARKDELEHNRYIEPNGFRSNSTLTEPPNV